MDENWFRLQFAPDRFRIYRALPLFLDGVNGPVTLHAPSFAQVPNHARSNETGIGAPGIRAARPDAKARTHDRGCAACRRGSGKAAARRIAHAREPGR